MSENPNIPRITDSLKTILSIRPRIDEKSFVEFFLPGFISPTEDINIEAWLSIAGNPLAPVDVVDENGDVLYTIPPLLRSVSFEESTKRTQFSEVIKTADALTEMAPNRGLAYFQESMNRATPKPKADVSSAKVWNAICDRYNIPHIFGVGTPTSESKSSSADADFTDEF